MMNPLRAAAPCDRTLCDLFARAGVLTEGNVSLPAVRLTSLTDDSRFVKPGGCFVAVRGIRYDGHQFVEAAARGGAAAIVIDQDVTAPQGPACIRVADTRVALAKLAASCYGLRGDDAVSPCLIGITGTNGKTTVAWLLRSILWAADRRPALIGTIEYDLLGRRIPAPLTTPGQIELCNSLAVARDAGATDAVLEVSSHALDQRRCDGLSFTAGVFTNLSGDHLDYHKTMDAYAEAKRRLFDGLDAGAKAVVPHDEAWAEWMVSRTRARTVTFGLDCPAAEVHGRIETIDSAGADLTLVTPDFEFTAALSLLGRYNVLNALSAAATAYALGIGPDPIRLGLERLTAVPGRLQRAEPNGCPFTVLIDYAHTDDALRNALEAVRPLTSRRLICVFGCGGDRDRGKRPRMAAAVAESADVAYVTSDNPRTEDPRRIIDDVLMGFGQTACGKPTRRCRVEVEAARRAAIEAAIAEARPGDTILIAGKGHETYQLVGDKVLSFDDAAVVRDCLGQADALESVA